MKLNREENGLDVGESVIARSDQPQSQIQLGVRVLQYQSVTIVR